MPAGATYRIETVSALGRVELNARAWVEPIDIVGLPTEHRLELCLIPVGNARACFPERWGSARFERMGSAFLFPAGQAVRARSDCKRQYSVDCCLDPARVAAWFDGDLAWSDRQLERGLDVASPAIHALMHRLADEVRHPGFASDALIELVSAQIALELARYCDARADTGSAGGLAPWRLRRIDARLADDMTPPSLDDLARLCDLSVRQLARGFRASRGVSIGTHIATRRIEHARALLATDLPVAQVAERLGFSSAGNFATAFRRATGQSPREHRHRAHLPAALE